MEFLLQLDHQIFFLINGLQAFWLDWLLAWPTFLGDKAVLIPLVLICFWIFDRKNFFRNALLFLTCYLVVVSVVQAVKFFIARPRPFDFYEGVQTPLPPKYIFEKPANHAFPSGHAAVSFCAAMVINHLYGKRFLILYAVAVLVSLTRIYVGAHFPTDVVAGAMIGSFLTLWVLKIYAKTSTPLRN